MPYTVADDPATAPSLEVTSGDYCSGAEHASGSARTCGTPVDGAPVLLPWRAAVLRLLHDAPAHPWTVAEAAAKVGVFRAALARRFPAKGGEPPMAYLANWRIALAADLLRQTDLTVDAIARKVGYANGYALSVAFKRLRGTRPSAHRNAEPARRSG